MSKPGFRTGKLLVWVSKLVRSAPCWDPWSKWAPSMVLQISKAMVVIIIWVLQVWIQSAKVCKPVVPRLSSFICHIESACRARSEWELPLMISMLGESCLFSVGSLFPLEELETQGSCCCGASLTRRRGKVLKVQPLPLPPREICLGHWGAGSCFCFTLTF